MSQKNIQNYKTFFVDRLHILTAEEFDTIADYCHFFIKMPNKEHSEVIIDITLSKIMPLTTYNKIQNHKVTNLILNLIVDPKTLGKDYSLLDSYITYWISKNHADSANLKELLSTNNILVNDGAIKVKYVTSGEMSLVQKYEKELLLYLYKANFDISKVEFVLDKERQARLLANEYDRQKMIQSSIDKALQENSPEEINKKRFAVNGKVTPMKEIDVDQVRNDCAANIRTNAILCGEITKIEERPSKKNANLYRCYFSLYDYDGGAINAVYILNTDPDNSRVWAQKKKPLVMPLSYVKSFKVGDWVNVSVTLQCDKFTKNALEARIWKMSKIDKPDFMIGKDDAPKKRVELLAHSNYSAYDGVDSVETIYKFAKSINHTALAVVDRHDVQSFPDAANHISDESVKKIWGVELEMIEDMIPVCVNPHGQNLEKANYVVFDIETTGLYPEYEDLIEFGAIKWEKGQIKDNLDLFVKPTKPLTPVAINMSHITEDMVKDAIGQKEALIKIKEYIGDSVLIAHNGIKFDINFLNKLCEKYGLEPINNTLIDTLEISHSINKDFTRHNLGTLTRKLKIDYNELIAHRADKDSEYLLSVWKYFLKRLVEMGISNVDEINPKLQNETLKANRRGYFVDIYAKNENGVKALYKLVTKASTEQLYLRNPESSKLIGSPKIHYSNLEPYRKDIIVCPHPMDGEIWDAAINDTQEHLEQKIKRYDYIFVCPSKNFEHLVYRDEITKQNVLKALAKIINTANKIGIKPIAVSDAYYCLPYEKQFHEIIVYQKQLGGKPHWLRRHDSNTYVPDFHLMTTPEMIKEFSFLKDDNVINDLVVENSNAFADSIEKVLPIKLLRPGKNGKPKYPYSPKWENCEKLLTDLVLLNANKIWPNGIPEDVKARIDKELNAIISNGYAVVYWISHLLVKKSNEDGYLVGSRGSVGSSIVAYLANISEVNPLPPHYICKKCHHYEPYADTSVDGFDLPKKKCPVCGEEMFSDGHNIPFESFLGQDCDKIPDIDLNFSGEYQAKAHNFIKNMFGPTHSFRAGTVSTVAAKTAYGFVKSYFEETDPNGIHSEALVDAMASKCANVKKTTGQHPGGIVVVPQDKDLEDFCPAQYPSNDRSNTWMTTHFDYHQMNEVLLKFDILGHDEPTILNHLQKATGVDPRTIPYFDEKVIEMFADSKSIGIIDPSYDLNQIATFALPEFGTALTRKIVFETQPKGVGDLVKISGLSHGTNVWQGNAQDLIKTGAKLSQVICCREDIVDYLQKSGLSFASAFDSTEKIRKNKGLPLKYEQEMINARVPAWYIESCKKIKYLFPKAHATAYVIDALRTAWYKVYYPVQFYAVWLSIRTDKAFDIETIKNGKHAVEEKLKKIKEMIAHRDPDLKEKDEELIPILEVCLEMFARGITMQNISLTRSDATEFICDGNSLIPPFISLDGLGKEVATSIIEARNKKPFTSKEDLAKRTKLQAPTIVKLDELHVLDGLSIDDQIRLF